MSDINDVRERLAAISVVAGARVSEKSDDLSALLADHARLQARVAELEAAQVIDLEQFRVQANGAIDSLTQNRIYPADVDFALACMRHILGMIDGSKAGPAQTIKIPANCRERLRIEGRSYPKSGCAHCKTGGMTGCPYESAVHQDGEVKP